MILSDKQIETGDWTYTSFQISHLEANARIRELKAKLLNLIKIVEIVNWDHDGGMVEITEQEYRLIKDAIRVAKEE